MPTVSIGKLPFPAPIDRGRTAQAYSPLAGGTVFAEPQRGEPSADGEDARHLPRGQGRTPAASFLLNSYLPLFLSLAQIRDRRPLRNRRTTEDFLSATDELPSESVLLSNLFAVSETVLLPRRFLTRYPAGANLGIWYNLSRKSIITARCAALHGTQRNRRLRTI